MRAVILAGGRGRRLEPITLTIPKVLAPVGEVPILEIVLRQLQAAAFTEVTLALGHLGELVEAYVISHASRFEGLDVTTVFEDEPTGTAGALELVAGLDQTFLVLNGDILTNLDFGALVADHRASDSLMTVACTSQRLGLESGVLHFDAGTGALLRYEEKPEITFTVSMGVYVYEPQVLHRMPRRRPLDQPEVVQQLLSLGERVNCFETQCAWYDIGTGDGYRRAQDHFAADPEAFLPSGHG
jgi:NDP-sugar pyrophosphorylase family protein